MQKKEEKQSVEPVLSQNKFFVWIDNVWYHYKWPIIVAVFFLCVGLFGFAQCSTRETNDLMVGYVGEHSFFGTEEGTPFLDTLKALKKASGEEKSIGLASYTVMSEEEMKALATNEKGEYSATVFQSMRAASQSNYSSFLDFRMTGETAVWFMSEYAYNECQMQVQAVPLSEILSEAPAASYDGYAVRLGDTAFYQYYEAARALPADTLVVLARPYVMGSTANEETYRQYTELFCALVEFKAP